MWRYKNRIINYQEIEYILTFFAIVTPRDWIRSRRGALHDEYNILSLILQLYPGMLYIKTKKKCKNYLYYVGV